MMSMKWWRCGLLCLVVLDMATALHGAAPDRDQPLKGTDSWGDVFYDYRVRMDFEQPISGRVKIAFSPRQLADLLSAISPEPMDIRALPFERCVLVDRATGKNVGKFELQTSGDNLVKNADFSLENEKLEGWSGFTPASMKVETLTIEGRSLNALTVRNETFSNSRVSQPIALELGGAYALSFWRRSSVGDASINATLIDPGKRLYADHFQSYKKYLTPPNVWQREVVLHDAQVTDARLDIFTGFAGSGSIAGIELHKAEWNLVADVGVPSSGLDLYLSARAGHRLTTLKPEMLASETMEATATPVKIVAEIRPENESGFLSVAPHASIWSFPSETPLQADLLARTKPLPGKASSFLDVGLCRGGSVSILLAVETGTPLLQILEATADLPVAFEVQRIAPLTIYDGPFPLGKPVQTRFDPLMAIDDPAIPPVPGGIHLICLTLRADAKAKPGVVEGTITLKIQDQVPHTSEFKIPIKLDVSSIVLNPSKHFSAIFGNQLWMLKYPLGDPFPEEQITAAEFHGFKNTSGVWDEMAFRISMPDRLFPDRAPIMRLARKYYHKMMDYHLAPQVPYIFSDYSYEIETPVPGSAPVLKNWNFTRFDEAINELVVGRDMPWLCIFHTNGFQMHKFTLRDGTTYSFKDKPDGFKEPWIKLTESEFFKLIGEFFEAQAINLEKLGVLDRAVFVIDECDGTTYDTVRKYREAVRAQSHASRIRFANTTYHGEFFTKRNGEGKLLMDEVIDIPIPINDEHFNFFEPEYKGRLKPREHGLNWVYYVSTDHWDLTHSGLSTLLTPLKLKNFGIEGWYCWASLVWSGPYGYPEPPDYIADGTGGPQYNPWLNPYYHHGPGVVSFFYPPDPRGISPVFTEKIIPSYRLALMRDGIELRALIEVLEAEKDDAGNPVKVDRAKLDEAKAELDRLWYVEPVQWSVSYGGYRKVLDLLHESMKENE